MAESEGKAEKSDVAKREEEILDFWQKNNIFEKSEQKDAPKGEFVFYDGPPFATGFPHYGHILAGTIKDAIPRYKTMRGYQVRRKWGWDCHGLPLENEIEKELGLKNKKDIEELGVGKFNVAARNAVLRYADDWKKIVPRMGRFVDMENDYKTMDTNYTESVWWVFAELNRKGLIYEGFKSMHLCPRCGTTLSNFEVAQGYKDIVDFAVTVKLELKDEPNTYLLVWTTTPWTLPGNMAAAVHEDSVYVRIQNKAKLRKTPEGEPFRKFSREYFIIAKEKFNDYFAEAEFEILEELKGSELIGKSYKPPFDYFVDSINKGKVSHIDQKTQGSFDRAWKIYHAPYVSLEEGTGAVHLAPAFGAEDMELAQEKEVPLVHHVDKEGKFTEEVKDFAGMAVKPKDTKEEPNKHQEADIEIIKNLAHRNLLFKKEKVTHSYPHCWRCDTPLLNYAATSWFVRVKEIKEKILKENKKIGWIPESIGEKRFGNWIENSPDWAISRARYWGAPLPVWKNEKTEKLFVMSSVEDLKNRVKKSGNSYFLMRHGEADSNTKGVVSSVIDAQDTLTERGKEQVEESLSELRAKNIDLIFASPYPRVKETAELIAQRLDKRPEDIVFDKRLQEIQLHAFNGRPVSEYHAFLHEGENWSMQKPEGGESWQDVKQRAGDCLYELEKQYQNKNILIVAHNSVLRMMESVSNGWKLDTPFDHDDDGKRFNNGEVRTAGFVPLPHNARYELDLHRPFIDEIELVDEDGTLLERVPDVFDCWFESGSMPYGQHHYPFENTDIFEPKGGLLKRSKGYPADFIAEGLDQTRGWFYSLIVLGTALFDKAPYKNVIVNGLVLAEDGAKMSKRLKNYPDPMDVVDKYGADAIRYYLLSSPIVRGEDLNFSEKSVAEVMRKNIGRLSNVHAFYKLYEGDRKHTEVHSPHVLDRWIIARFNELVRETTKYMDAYELDKGARPLSDFIDDLSTWYLRRSRDRFKEEGEDKEHALATLRFVLEGTAKIMAPFMPFHAEYLFREVRSLTIKESVHLEAWPEAGDVNSELLEHMKHTRDIVSLALEARAHEGIKVRQPLSVLKMGKELGEEFNALIRDEVNVKEVVFDEGVANGVSLDTTLTPELKEEGMVRDVIRHIQELRKKEELTPHDAISLIVASSKEGEETLKKFEDDIKKSVLAESISYKETDGPEVFAGGEAFTLSLERI